MPLQPLQLFKTWAQPPFLASCPCSLHKLPSVPAMLSFLPFSECLILSLASVPLHLPFPLPSSTFGKFLFSFQEPSEISLPLCPLLNSPSQKSYLSCFPCGAMVRLYNLCTNVYLLLETMMSLWARTFSMDSLSLVEFLTDRRPSKSVYRIPK